MLLYGVVSYNTTMDTLDTRYLAPLTFDQSTVSGIPLYRKSARVTVSKCPCKLLQPADRPMAGSSSLEGHFGTGLCTRFSSAWSNVECGSIIQFHHSQHLLLLSKQVNVQGRQSELKIGSCTRCSPKPSHNFQGRAGSLVLV